MSFLRLYGRFVLYSFIRHFNPKRIVEIGSGYSSSLMLDTNEIHYNGKLDLTFIKPYPNLLKSLMKRGDNAMLIPQNLQLVSMDTFSTLESNDFLFIDSTHVSKIGSDVNKIFFEILPRLATGTIIHLHDIFWPFEYPETWVKEGRTWNETYMLRAFLQYNESFEILFFSDYLHKDEANWIKANMPLLLKGKGGNFWIRKKK